MIDSDPVSVELISAALYGAGYDSVVTGSVTRGLILAREIRPVLVVTELILPDGTGLDVVTRLSVEGIPVMVLSDRGNMTSKVTLLKAGAADYLGKPFEVRELLARVRLQLLDRRVAEGWEELVVGDLALDVQRRRVMFREKEVRLTERERDVLEELMRERDRVFSYQELLERVWGAGAPVTTANSNVLAVTVSSIRRKLHAANAFGYLVTVRGTGYVLREHASI